MERLSVVVLDSKGVDGVGDVKTLTQLCPSVKELHLNCNSITHGDDVSVTAVYYSCTSVCLM